jgi:hypothetical protein
VRNGTDYDSMRTVGPRFPLVISIEATSSKTVPGTSSAPSSPKRKARAGLHVPEGNIGNQGREEQRYDTCEFRFHRVACKINPGKGEIATVILRTRITDKGSHRDTEDTEEGNGKREPQMDGDNG